MRIRTLLAGTLLLIGGASVPSAGPAEWPLGDVITCVAYRTHKDTLFASNVEVLGRNCGVSVQVERDAAGERFRVLVTVPVDGFDSGVGRRDRHVAEILGGAEKSPVAFTSVWLDADAFRALLAGESAPLGGELRIRGVSQPVTVKVSANRAAAGRMLRARLVTTFAALGVTVPTVGPFGMIARPKPEVEILGQFLLPPDLMASLTARHE